MKALTSRTPERRTLAKLRLRPALSRDHAAVLAIQKEAALEPGFDQKELLVAEHRGKVVGCLRLKFLGDCFELASLGVKRSYQGRGVGTLLVRGGLERADERVFLLTRESSFFARFGFRIIDTPQLPSELKRKLERVCKNEAVAMAVDAGNPTLKTMRLLREKTKKDIGVTKRALDKVRIVAPVRSHYRKVAEDFLNMARSYYSDALHFLKNGNMVLAFAAVNYAHGWLDAGARLGLFDVDEDDQLFTLAE